MKKITNIDKIIKALQDLYRSNSEILEALDTLKLQVQSHNDALKVLNEYNKHLQSFEEKVFKNFFNDTKNKWTPPKYLD